MADSTIPAGADVNRMEWRPMHGGLIQTAVVIKTTHACNLACRYCYSSSGVSMPADILMATIETCCDSYDAVKFIFHGGEPLLTGIGFFETALDTIERCARPGSHVSVHIQTNATLLDDDWCDFIASRTIDVGVSVDGPRAINDAWRIFPDGNGTFTAILDGVNRLVRRGIPPGALAVVTPASASHPREVMRFFTDSPFAGVDFLACTRPGMPSGHPSGNDGGPGPDLGMYSEAYSEFMLEAFKVWFNTPAPRTPVRFFHEILSLYNGYDASLCSLSPGKHCGRHNFTVDSDGGIYFCDDFIGLEEWRLGSIMKDTLSDVFTGPRYRELRSSVLTVPDGCRRCAWVGMCQGGCAYHRFLTSPDLTHGSLFCGATRRIMDYLGTNLATIGGV